MLPGTLRSLLQSFDPAGNWVGSGELGDDFLRDKSPLQLLEELGQRGPWLAQVGKHMVVVDGIDPSGYLRVRDPWYEPGLQRGIRVGSQYRVSFRTFFELWGTGSVYRR